jgi:hypothetical protein
MSAIKRNSKLRRTPLRRVGKKGKLNQKANRILAKEFKGPQYCEATFPHDCTGSEQLTWAHNAKRRKLSTEDLTHAALICINAHNVIEVKSPEEMKAIVDEIIQIRELNLEVSQVEDFERYEGRRG